MKNTKKAVALALALSVGGQAIPSSAEDSDVISDIVAPSSNSDLETFLNSHTNEITIIQKSIYDLDSGLDVNSVKAYIYEEESEDKGVPVEMDGNDFSDFNVTTKIPETSNNLVVEVYASDLAGNEAEISRTVVDSSLFMTKSVAVSGSIVEAENMKETEDRIYIDGKNSFTLTSTLAENSGELEEVKFIINTSANESSAGIVLSGSFSSSEEFKSSGSGLIDINTNNSFIEETDINSGLYRSILSFDVNDGLKDGDTYYLWTSYTTTSGKSGYSAYPKAIVIDKKAPESSNAVDLMVSVDNVLFVTQDGLLDEGSGLKEVYALIKNPNMKEPQKVGLTLEESNYGTGKSYNCSFDLKTLNVSKGTFDIEVYAIDNCGNEGLISKGQVTKDMVIESEETVEVSGEVVEDNNVHWFAYEGSIEISSVSNSKSKVYNGAQIVINEDSEDYTNKVLAEFKIGSKEDLTNITDNKYFDLVSKKYSTNKLSNGTFDYSNNVECELLLKDATYNKSLNVWIVYYTDDGIYSKPVRFGKEMKTDYVAPSLTISKESNNYIIKAEDNESGIKSLVVYDANGLVVNDTYNNYTGKDGVSISEDLNPSTVTVIDMVDNKVVYNVKTGEIVEGVGSTDLPSKPTEPDVYIDPSDVVMEDDSNDNVGDDNVDDDNSLDDNLDDDNNSDDDNVDDDTDNVDDGNGDLDGDSNNNNSNNNSNDQNNNQDNDNNNDNQNTDDNNNNQDTDNNSNNQNTDNNSQNNNDQNVNVSDQNSDNQNPSQDSSDNSSGILKLPQTGREGSLLLGFVGVVTSAIGFLLYRKNK